MKSNNVKILFVEICVVKKHFGVGRSIMGRALFCFVTGAWVTTIMYTTDRVQHMLTNAL